MSMLNTIIVHTGRKDCVVRTVLEGLCVQQKLESGLHVYVACKPDKCFSLAWSLYVTCVHVLCVIRLYVTVK